MSTFSISVTLGMNAVLLPALQQLFNMTSKQMGEKNSFKPFDQDL
jgi:hypothetical protein